MMIEGLAEEKAKKSYWRKVSKELAVSQTFIFTGVGQKGLEQRKCVV